MDAGRAIADLTDVSPQVRDVAVGVESGGTLGANVPPARAEELLAAARRLLTLGDDDRDGRVGQLEVAMGVGSVFVVRDAGRLIIATASPDPTVGLVFYDLKSCLRSIGESEEGA